MILKIAEKIKYAREKNGLTQTELARKMSITRSSVNAWEMGISIPSTEKIAELSIILNVSSDFLLGISSDETVKIDMYSNEEKELIYNLLNILSNK